MKKALHIVQTVLLWALPILAVLFAVVTVLSLRFFERDDRTLFGYHAYVVLSDSMAKTDFAAGDLVFVKETDVTTLQEGDIISYRSYDTASYGKVVTHKIRTVLQNGASPAFITYGTTTDTNDPLVVNATQVLGKYEGHIPKLGTFFNFIRTVPGFILCVFVPLVLVIVLQGIQAIAIFRRQCRAERAELDSVRQELEAERARFQAEYDAWRESHPTDSQP